MAHARSADAELAQASVRSYTSRRAPLRELAAEAWALYRLHQRVESLVSLALGDVRRGEHALSERFGVELRHKRVLDAGCGQHLECLSYLALRNDAVGLDLDVVPRGWDPAAYLRMLRLNGPRRASKTVVRKLLAIDRRYSREIARQLGVRRLPRLDVRHGDLQRIPFGDASFDAVYSRSALQYVVAPSDVLREIARVLRPGGVAYLLFHLHTTPYGLTDPRTWVGDTTPPWSHLRASMPEVAPQAVLNRVRLPQWGHLCSQQMPGSEVASVDRPYSAELEAEARRLRASGELADYSLDELLSASVAVVWQKPR